MTVEVVLPHHLRTLARVAGPIRLEVDPPVTTAAILDALERRYPVLEGTIRDRQTGQRRPFMRFFAAERDMSLEPSEAAVPEAVAQGREPFFVVGAIAGGRR